MPTFFKEMTNPELLAGVENDDSVLQAINRANVESVPFWKQDLGFKLIKMNEINFMNWNNTKTFKAVDEYLKVKPPKDSVTNYRRI